MKAFEIDKEYFTHSICDSDCIFTIKVTGRTAKTVSYEYLGRSRRSKIQVDASGEFIQPDRYSMAPTFRAEREVQPEGDASGHYELDTAEIAGSKILVLSELFSCKTAVSLI